MLANFREDPYQALRRIILNGGRAYVLLTQDQAQDPRLIFVSGVAFDYVFGDRLFGIIPAGGATISVAIDLPEFPPSEVEIANLDLLLHMDPTPGALEAVLAASGGIVPITDGGYPSSFSMLISADNANPDDAYNGTLWTLSDQGMTGQIRFGATRDEDVFEIYDPPIPPINI